jgi:thiol-disulfide isomerase/thioredoxin
MKYILSSLFIFGMLCQNAICQYSVQFQQASWEETKEKAQAENKLIFVDGFTTWCEPCKMMDIQVFNRSQVARFFNRNFINYKMDMEKGQGPILALNYEIREYPSFLFLTSDGTLVHKVNGYQHADEMIASAQPALLPENKTIAWDKRFAGGDRKADFLYNYTFERLRRMDDSHREVVQAYLETQEDWNLDHNVKYIYQFMEDIDSEMFHHMAQHRTHFESVIGKEEVSRSIDIMVNNKIYNSYPAANTEEVCALYRLAYPDTGEKLAAEYAMKKYQEAGEFEKYMDIAMKYYPASGPLFTNKKKQTFVTDIFEKSQNPYHIQQAYQWAKEIQEEQPSLEHHLQTANFQLRLKQKKEGMKTVKTAMKMAKKAKDKREVSNLKILLKKFKAMA